MNHFFQVGEVFQFEERTEIYFTVTTIWTLDHVGNFAAKLFKDYPSDYHFLQDEQFPHRETAD